MTSLRKIVAYSTFVAALASGFGMWAVISSGDERQREILKHLPESNPVRMEDSRQNNVLMLQVLKEAAETNENIARRFGGLK